MLQRIRLSRWPLLSAVAMVVLCASAPVVAAGSPEFPRGYTGYHTYAEMVAEIDAAVAAHPGIVSKFSIGQSYEGRAIWATPLFIERGFAGNRNAVWTDVSVDLDAFAGQAIRLLIQARDSGADSLIEAAVDDVRVYQAPTP